MSSKSHILLFTLAFLASFCSQINAHATSSGIIDIKIDSHNQFYVDVDFSYYWGAAQNSSKASGNTTLNSSSDTGRMMISVANSDTMVVGTSCFSFNDYNCSSHPSCNKSPNTRSIDYPSFTATSQLAQSVIYLDYNYWSLSTSNYLYITFQCNAGASSSNFGSGLSGVLGLGTGNGGSSNFGYSPIFSIFINSDLTGGKLLFKSDTNTYAQSSNSIHSFYASSAWQITTSSAYIQVGSYSVSFSGNIIFDINSKAIGLPQSYYNSFLTYFGDLSGVYCYSGYNSRPYCYYNGQLKNLPDIILSVSGSQIRIPSAIYASYSSTSGSYTYFYFNFKATSPYLSGVSYVPPSFQNSIILDANFMSYYYTVFDATSGSNYIYLYPSINASINIVKWIVFGAVFAILLISICCCYAKKKRGAVTSVIATPVSNPSFNNTIQTPIVYSQPVPTYSYDANQYNYPAYQGVYQNYQQPQGYIPPINYQGNIQ